MILAGRGFGKTRTGAETVRVWAKSFHYVNLIGPTADDAREVMIEGESGLLRICPKHERPDYQPHKRRLVWPSGCISSIFTADSPERLRGKQHEKLWADELGAWRYADAWDQAMLGLRIGINPQTVVTTTPKPTRQVKTIAADPTTHLTTGTTYDNRGNLAPAFFNRIIRRYEGTRLGRQELNAEILTDNPNALWQRSLIDEHRVRSAPTLLRVVVGIDPAVTSNEDSNETGIVVAGIGEDGHGYILDDRSLMASPGTWAKVSVAAYKDHKADRVIGEVNNGGDLVEHTVRTENANVPYLPVRASRGKARRAEPVAALYEQGKIHHVGSFPALEDQMCDFDPLTPDKKSSPDRMDALVWALTFLFQDNATGLLDYYAAEKRQADEARKKAKEQAASNA